MSHYYLTVYRVEAAVYNHTAAVAAETDDELRGDEVNQLASTKKNFTTIEEAAVAAVLMEADIIVTTCIGAGVSCYLHLYPHSCSFSFLFLFYFHGI